MKWSFGGEINREWLFAIWFDVGAFVVAPGEVVVENGSISQRAFVGVAACKACFDEALLVAKSVECEVGGGLWLLGCVFQASGDGEDVLLSNVYLSNVESFEPPVGGVAKEGLFECFPGEGLVVCASLVDIGPESREEEE